MRSVGQRVSRRLGLRKDSSRLGKPVEELGDLELEARSERVVKLRGVSLAYLNQLQEDVFNGFAAPGVDLYVAKVDLSDEVEAGCTIRQVLKPEQGYAVGKVPYVEDEVQYAVDSVVFKPREDWTVGDVCEEVIMGSKARKQCFWLDKIEKKHAGKIFQGAFLIHARGCKFRELMSAVTKHFENQVPENVFVWIDFISYNQAYFKQPDENLPREIAQERDDFLVNGLHETISRFEDTLVFIDKWNVPAPLKRSWCLWELVGVLEKGKLPQAIFAPDQDSKFLEELLDDPRNLMHQVAEIDSRSAVCSVLDDKEKIAKAIESQLRNGFSSLNAMVLENMKTWLSEMTDEAVERSRQSEPRSLKFATICNQAGAFLLVQNRIEKAMLYLEEALDVRRKGLGDRHPDVANTLFTFGEIYLAKSSFDQALDLFNEALEIWRDKVGDHDFDVSSALFLAGQAYFAKHSFENAREYLEESLEIRRELLGDRDPNVAAVLGSMGDVSVALGALEIALEFFDEALDIYKCLQGSEMNVAAILSKVASVHDLRGASEKSLQCHEEALQLYRERPGIPPDLATALSNVAEDHRKLGEFEKSLQFFEEALDVVRKRVGNRHLDVAEALDNVGAVQTLLGKWEDAFQTFQEALNIRRERVGDRHPDFATSLHKIGWLHREKGELETALTFLLASHEINLETLGEDNAETKSVFELIGECMNELQSIQS